MSAYTTLSFANTPRESVDAQVEQEAVVKGNNKQIEKYRELNPAERRLVNQPYTVTGLARDVATTLIIDTRDEAYRATQERYGHQDDGTSANAFQHCYWSGIMTRMTSRKFAKEWGDAHERYQRGASGVWRRTPPKSPNVAMDLYNNNIGRAIGYYVSTKNGGYGEIALICQNLEREGKLRVLRR